MQSGRQLLGYYQLDRRICGPQWQKRVKPSRLFQKLLELMLPKLIYFMKQGKNVFASPY
jgi:hypothetical protein